MIIKKSCAFRTKYQVKQEVHISPFAVVPHPLNRGGEKCTVLRCRGITSDIARSGFDVVEADQNAVMIESPPHGKAKDEVRRVCCDPDYEKHFVEEVLDDEKDIDVCIRWGGSIVGGSVSRSHLNVTLRNIYTGRVGVNVHVNPMSRGR